MKKFFALLLVALLFVGLNSFYKLHNTYSNIFEQLGLGAQEADSYIIGNIIGGSTSFPRTKIMARLALDKRKVITRVDLIKKPKGKRKVFKITVLKT